MVQGRIGEISFDKKSCGPVIVNFENGELIRDKTKKFECSIFEDEVGSFVPTLTTGNMIYSNRITRDDDLYYKILAVRNMETNKIRLMALDTVSLKASPVNQKDFALNSSFAREATIMDLNKTFGSKRTQRQTELTEKLRVNVEAVRDDLEKSVADINVDSTFLEQSTSSNIGLHLPPRNESATTREDVYKLNDIVPKRIMRDLDEVAEKIMKGEEKELVSTEYVKNELEKLRKRSNAKIETVKLLLILDCLMTMSMATLKVISLRTYNACPYSESVSHYLLDSFTTSSERNSSRSRSVAMKQKGISHILLFALICGKYQVDLEEIGKTMKLSIKKLQETCKALLFTPNKNRKKVFELVLPLPKQPVRVELNKGIKRK